MVTRQDQFATVAGYELHYSEWGSRQNDPVVCLHGFSRTGRDFDVIAPTLAEEYWVVCPDLLGRGLSEWANTPADEYVMDGYAARLVEFVDALGIASFRCIGISAGGSLAIRLAGADCRDEITHVVINDMAAGTEDDPENGTDYDRIQTYLADPPAFETITELETYYRNTYAQYSPMTDHEWRRFTITSARRTDDGSVTPAYDPRVVAPYFQNLAANAELWDEWGAITADIFLLNGEHSEILSDRLLDRMTAIQPESTVEVVPDCGHKPSMNVPEQIDPIMSFLASSEPA